MRAGAEGLGLVTFEEFVDGELLSLARYARALTSDRQQAHDVLADALMTAQLHWKRIDTMAHPAAYVRRIVTTTFLGQRRRWFNRNVTVTATGEVPDQAMPDPTGAVDDRDHLQQLLARLPRQQCAAIVLRFYLDLGDNDIAAELGCTSGTACSYISRGLATLRIADTDGPTNEDATIGRGRRRRGQEKR